MNTSVKEEQFKIFDNVAKAYVDKVFNSLGEAEAHKEQLLDNGEYPDRPHTVFEIHPVASVKEEVKPRDMMDNLIVEHLQRFGENNLFRASLDNFRETGKASGSFRAALHAMMSEYSKKQNHELLEALKGMLPLADDGYALHKKNGSHQEFLSEDRERLTTARALINKHTISKSNINEQSPQQ